MLIPFCLSVTRAAAAALAKVLGSNSQYIFSKLSPLSSISVRIASASLEGGKKLEHSGYMVQSIFFSIGP